MKHCMKWFSLSSCYRTDALIAFHALSQQQADSTFWMIFFAIHLIATCTSLYCYLLPLPDANKTGVAHEAINNIRRASKTMTEQEARQILGVSENSTWEEIVQRYDNLFERNGKSGSFYLQSKVHRAKECLETVYQKNKQDEPPNWNPAPWVCCWHSFPPHKRTVHTNNGRCCCTSSMQCGTNKLCVQRLKLLHV